ncbi:uncharacterized protein LOC110622471 [Manihot esculenta]|uniref:Uncharacterized protein n=1 Tax=Manihot esculenta TaxID=3983 RepID=A0A2C9V864_MANES|nr:uncharacterized protein LOC110622471 [Manihot esculenta]OAY40858.1 hypothetical protein MANES_09G055000v8 [Manihot esculenta]
MGNCLVLQEKLIKVMKPDGKILEYKAPITVHQVLSDFSGHAISDSLQAFQHLLPETKLLGGKLYYLVPLPLPSPKAKKKVRFSVPEEEDKKENIVRIKLVISKQELQEILQKEGVTVDSMISQLQDQRRVETVDTSDNTGYWKPVLESIPEID